jgi:hypothetical protein
MGGGGGGGDRDTVSFSSVWDAQARQQFGDLGPEDTHEGGGRGERRGGGGGRRPRGGGRR